MCTHCEDVSAFFGQYDEVRDRVPTFSGIHAFLSFLGFLVVPLFRVLVLPLFLSKTHQVPF